MSLGAGWDSFAETLLDTAGPGWMSPIRSSSGKSLGPGWDSFSDPIPKAVLGPGWDSNANPIPGRVLGSGWDDVASSLPYSGIRSAQFTTNTITNDRFTYSLSSIIATAIAVDLTTIGTTSLLTVPTDTAVLIQGVILRTTSGTATTNATISVGINPSTTNLFGTQELIDFRATNDVFSFWFDKSTTIASIAADQVDLSVTIAAAGTLIADIYIIGLQILEIPWNPSMISGVQGWWRADLGVTLNGSDVSSWTNQITYLAVQEITQATPANQPLFIATQASLNSQPVVQFDGTSETLVALGEIPSAAANLLPSTYLMVIELDIAGTLQTLFETKSSTNQGIVNFRTLTGTDFQFYTAGVSGTGSVGPLSASVPAEIMGQWPDSSNRQLTINGTAATLGVATSGLVQTGTDISLGASVAGTEFFQGKIAELVIIPGIISAEDRASWVSYVNTRYGLSATP